MLDMSRQVKSFTFGRSRSFLATARVVISVLGIAVFVAGCVASAPKRDLEKVGRSAQELVFPSPPDEPRFVFERAIRGSADVQPETEDSALKRALTGVGSTTEVLGKPYAIAVHRGKIFVSDSADRVVRVFDVPNQKHYRIAGEGDGAMAKPMGIDIDEHGSLFVADATLKQILVYDESGKFLRRIGDSTMFSRLSSVTVDPKGERLYVVDIGGVTSDQHRVRVFDAVAGKHLYDIGKRGSGDGEFNLPRDVAIGKDGRIYVVDGGNFRVQIFDKDGKYLKSFGSIGKQVGNFARPKEIAIDKQGNLYVADTAFGNFQIFDPEGQLLMFVGDRSEKDQPAGYMLPSGIAVDDDGRVFFVDQWFKRIDVFRPATLAADGGFLVKKKQAEKARP